MKMPSKIWIDARFCGKWSPVSCGTQRDEYIRADIAEELARALEDIARTKYGLQGIMEDYEGKSMSGRLRNTSISYAPATRN